MENQSLIAQKGEIEFRKKLISQQIDNKKIFIDEFDSKGIENILQDRMKKTFEQMTNLKNLNVNMHPYIEIGAERCQRSLVLENDFSINGAALDISYHMLNSAKYYQKVFNKNKVPMRICCDINNIPLKQNSIPFIFCYETLHHFPDPQPVINEIHRVLSPCGTFFFSEEPFKRFLHLNLYEGKKIYSNASLKRNKLKKILDYFLSRKSSNETDHEIIENENISLKQWKESLSIFHKKDINVHSFSYLNSKLFQPNKLFRLFLLNLLGGEIHGLCSKRGNNSIAKTSLSKKLICPSCKLDNIELLLIADNGSLRCTKCNKVYPEKNGVIFLFSQSKLKELYPELSYELHSS